MSASIALMALMILVRCRSKSFASFAPRLVFNGLFGPPTDSLKKLSTLKLATRISVFMSRLGD